MTSCHSTLCLTTTTFYWKLTTATEKGKGKLQGKTEYVLQVKY